MSPDSKHRSTSGFTLVELMVSIALVLLLILGINAVFTLSAKTVGIGQQVSELQRQFRNGEATLRNDFFNIATPGEMPAFWFTSYNVAAFMNQADEKSNPDYSPSIAALDAAQSAALEMFLDRSQPVGNAPNYSTQLNVVNNHNHRIDMMGFFAHDVYRRQTGGQFNDSTGNPEPTFQSNFTSGDAYIWYGHLLQPDNSSPLVYKGPGIDTDLALNKPSTAQTNPNNFYAGNWILGRVVTLMAAEDNNGKILDTRPVTPLRQVFFPKNASNFGPINSKVLLAPLGYGSVATDANGKRGSNFNFESKCDLAGMSMSEFRQLVVDTAAGNGGPIPLTTPAQMDAWYHSMVAQNNGAVYSPSSAPPSRAFRYYCKPWPQKDQSASADPSQAMHDELAQASPIFLRGCSQFIVEFAGDYMDQTGTPKVGEDGQLDWESLPADAANPNGLKRIQWYGMPRRHYDPGAQNTYIDVGRLVDIATGYGALPTSSPSGNLTNFPFEKLGASAFPNARPANVISYTCAWSPDDLDFLPGGPNETNWYRDSAGNIRFPSRSFLPWMIRITIRLDDPNGRLPDGQTMEYIFNLPRAKK